MTFFADLLGSIFERRNPSRLPAGDDRRPMPELLKDLMGAVGENRGAALAAQILTRIDHMDDAKKLAFFRHVSTTMSVDSAAVRRALDRYEKSPGGRTYETFMVATDPPRQELFRRLNQAPGATGRLVALRADLLRLADDDPDLTALDVDLRHLFRSWFNRGFLVLRRIGWESPNAILKKIIAYEAVHAINSRDELRHRLEPTDRRCFAFFHPAMPDDPLIFVEVALTDSVPNSIQALLDETRTVIAAEDANTAVFYSISNCQPGLANVSFGNSLIKQVVSDLAAELPGLKQFVTLSPMPGLRAWMEEDGRTGDPPTPDTLRRAAARYLLTAKRGDGQPRDPVARFHLGNGAQVLAVHAGADVSAKGLKQSAGAMVNYLYNIRRIAQNHERFTTAGEITASSEVRKLAKDAAPADK
ncbi:MAG: malonyl-CoA decarboxylase [Rhodospirillaceae bacterium]|nr:malonyl-CoA decarboxylase [Rhodospirillaceae bacterium]